MELVSPDRDCHLLLFREFDLRGVFVEIEVGADGEPGCRGGVGDEADDGLVGFQGTTTPIRGDSGKGPVLDLVPFAGARWVVADCDVESGGLSESGKFVFPQPRAVPVGSAAVGGDEQLPRVRVFL